MVRFSLQLCGWCGEAAWRNDHLRLVRLDAFSDVPPATRRARPFRHRRRLQALQHAEAAKIGAGVRDGHYLVSATRRMPAANSGSSLGSSFRTPAEICACCGGGGGRVAAEVL